MKKFIVSALVVLWSVFALYGAHLNGDLGRLLEILLPILGIALALWVVATAERGVRRRG